MSRTNPSNGPTLIVVQNEWNGWRTGWVRFADLEDVHWFQPLGAPRSLIHARIYCTSIVKGHLPHDCNTTTAPHRLMVCVLKCHTDPLVFDELSRSANALTPGLRHSSPSGGSRSPGSA
jgi:hypothetical protein